MGRSAEREALAEALKRLVRGESGVVIVEGEPGIGKSRLVESFIEQARDLRVPVLCGAGDPIEKAAPYHAWRDVFGRAFRLQEADDDLADWRAGVVAKLESRPEWARVAPLAGAVLPLELPDNELTAQMSGQVRAHNTCTLLVGLLAARQEGDPLVLVLDDAHWLDSASWGLVAAVWRGVRPLLLVLATRPLGETPPAELGMLREASGTLYVRLDVLPAEDIPAIVGHRLGADRMPDAVVALIQARAGGHPFFATELAAALLESGAIAVEGRECRIATPSGDLRDLRLPDTIQGVVTSRVDRLPPAQQLTLKVASVIGRVFAYRMLGDVHPIESDRPALADHLAALERLDLTPLESPEPDLVYIFKHVITQQVVYDLMLFAQRREIHRAIAEWFERVHVAGLVPFYPLLAHHWAHAEDPGKAAEYLGKAGDSALSNGAFVEAIGFFGQALALAPRAGLLPGSDRERLKLAKWEAGLGLAYFGVADLDEGRRHLEAGMALLGHPVPHTRAGLLISLSREMVVQACHRIKAPWERPRSRAADEASGLLLRVLEGLVGAYWNLSASGLIVNALLAGLNTAERNGERSIATGLRMGVAFAASFAGVHPIARYYKALATRDLQSIEDLKTRSLVNRCRGFVAWATEQDPRASESDLRQAYEQSRLLGDALSEAMCAFDLASSLYSWGRFGEAEEIHRREAEAAKARADYWLRAVNLSFLARNLLAVGRLDDALEALDEREGLPGTTRTPTGIISFCGLRARTALSLGAVEDALEQADLTWGALAVLPRPNYMALEGLAGMAATYLAVRERGLASAAAGDLVRKCRLACQALMRLARAFRPAAPCALRLKALELLLSGRQAAARRHWDQSLAMARAYGMPYEEGLTLNEIGRHLPASDPARRQHLEEAIAIFERIGAAWELEQARQALGEA